MQDPPHKNRLKAFVITLGISISIGFFLINLLGIYLVGPYGWDDGAITLAYAKTLAEHQLFALTPASEIVEGSSSLLYVFLIALLHKIIEFDFTDFILASQLIAFSAVCATLVFVLLSLKNAIQDSWYRCVIVLLLGTLPMFTAEVYNGMEMSLFAFLLFSLVVSYENKSRLIYFIIPWVLLTRFEAVFYLSFAFVFMFIFDKKNRTRIFYLGVLTLSIFVLITISRWLYFNDFLPNTLWAKINPPYSPGESFHLFKSSGITEFFDVHFFFIIVGITSLIPRILIRRNLDILSDLKFWLVISFSLFALLTGKNWGYDGRMFLACLPLLLMIIADNLTLPIGFSSYSIINFRNYKIKINQSVLVATVLIICLFGVHYSNFALHKINLQTALEGGYYQDRLPDPLRTRVEKHRSKTVSDPYWYGITPQNYHITGIAVEKIRTLLDLKIITFMVPDVGGLGLCCENIRVIDSALLTNSFLAKQGYKEFEFYLSKIVPDIIETHGVWSELSRIYQSSFFQDNYVPIIFDNNLFWIYKPQAEKLLQNPRGTKSLIKDLALIAAVRYRGSQIDRDYINQYSGAIWSLNLSVVNTLAQDIIAYSEK